MVNLFVYGGEHQYPTTGQKAWLDKKREALDGVIA